MRARVKADFGAARPRRRLAEQMLKGKIAAPRLLVYVVFRAQYKTITRLQTQTRAPALVVRIAKLALKMIIAQTHPRPFRVCHPKLKVRVKTLARVNITAVARRARIRDGEITVRRQHAQTRAILAANRPPPKIARRVTLVIRENIQTHQTVKRPEVVRRITKKQTRVRARFVVLAPVAAQLPAQHRKIALQKRPRQIQPRRRRTIAKFGVHANARAADETKPVHRRRRQRLAQRILSVAVEGGQNVIDLVAEVMPVYLHPLAHAELAAVVMAQQQLARRPVARKRAPK